MAANVTGNGTRINWGRVCYQDPNLPECAEVPSFYLYRIDLVPNAVFTAFFGLSLIGFVAVYAATRRGLGFFVAMALGLLCEIIGYAARILAYKNQWSENAFLAQICTLTIGPAFLAAGIYLCLRRIVYAFGPENSRIRPEYYTRIVGPSPPIAPCPGAGCGRRPRGDVQRRPGADPATTVHPLRCRLPRAAGYGRRHG